MAHLLAGLRPRSFVTALCGCSRVLLRVKFTLCRLFPNLCVQVLEELDAMG